MATATKTKKIQPEVTDDLALRYATDLLHQAILRHGEPVKTSEAAKLVGRDDFDMKLARVALVSSPDRFSSSDRKWGLWTRFGDPTRPVERSLSDILNAVGTPVPVYGLAREISSIYGRPAEIYDEMLARMLKNSGSFFNAGNDEFGLTSWLLITEGATADDVLFDNYLSEDDVLPFEKAAKGLNLKDLKTVETFLDQAGQPVPNAVLQYLLWKSSPDNFNATKVFSKLLRDTDARFLSSLLWVGPKQRAELESQFPALSEREVEEQSEQSKADAQQPLVISDADRETAVNWILEHGSISHGAEVLEDVFEVSPGDATFDGDLVTLVDALKTDERFLWLGADRFLPADQVPSYVLSIPEILAFNEPHYADAEGNAVDLELEQDGFDGGLDREIRSMSVVDVMDEDPNLEEDPNPPATARCVLRLHHKEIGTLPLCSLPARFFPEDAKILHADLTLPNGQGVEIWVNNETRLVYGLIDWYQTLPIDSGAVFYLERQQPDKYALTYGEETEPIMFVSRNRVNELIELGNRAEQEQLPTFEILREIMEHYRKGIEFTTAHTELNISRRTRRHMTASLLSGFHCFYQRGRAWVFDAKKLSQGFDKSKRKFIKKH